MFGLEFLFAAALWALPLAALPLILHLLYRRKSPIVPFSTLRFIQSSLQQSAARRKVQRWLLLAIRMLLLALLIWAVAQPAKILASRFFGSNLSTVAIVVVDTSWSMQYRTNPIPLVAEADQIVQQLLRDKLRDASVLLASSSADIERIPFRSSSELLSQWVPLKPEPNRRPLVDCVSDAMDLLSRNPAAQKLLVIVSDFQNTDFPRPIGAPSDPQLRIVALDLHPDRPRSAGVSAVSVKPAQVVAGIRTSVEVEVAGAPGDVRPVALSVTNLDGKELLARPPLMANLDDSGHAMLRFDMEMPGERWQLITAKLQGEDPMAWDDVRSFAIELPPQQRVLVWEGGAGLDGPRRLVRLALDPSEGRLANWPLRLDGGASLHGTENAVVALLDQVPSAATVQQWRDFVSSGGTVVLMLKPGIESIWQSAPADARKVMEQLLPSAPYQVSREEMLRVSPGPFAREEAATAGLADEPKALAELRASRIVPMNVVDQQSTRLLLATAAGDRRAAMDREGLLYLRKVGRGRVFTWACIPESVTTNLGTHPLFLPLLVNQCLRSRETSLASNATIGTSIVVDDADVRAGNELELRTPGGQVMRLPAQSRNGRRVFAYDDTADAGIYQVRKVGESMPAAVASVTGPANESEAAYRPAEQILPQTPGTLVARSMQELDAKITQVSQPQPRWSLPLAIAMLLLCAEGLLSNETAIWKWFGKRSG